MMEWDQLRFWDTEETVWEYKHNSYERNREKIRDRYTNLLGATTGSIHVTSENPLANKEIDDPNTSPAEAIAFFDKVHDKLEWQGKRPRYDVSITYDEDAPSLGYFLKQYRSSSNPQATVYTGTIAGVERNEIEDRLSTLMDVDRYHKGWQFDNLDGTVDEFVDVDETYTVSVPQLQDALMEGEIRNVSYAENDLGNEYTDREVISAFLAPETDYGPEDSEIEVEETTAASLHTYSVTVHNPPTEPAVDAPLEIHLQSQKPLFTDKHESEEDVPKDITTAVKDATASLMGTATETETRSEL